MDLSAEKLFIVRKYNDENLHIENGVRYLAIDVDGSGEVILGAFPLIRVVTDTTVVMQ